MQNHEVLRERDPQPRDLFLELQRIEERGRRLKQARRNKFARFIGMARKSTRNNAVGTV